MPVGLIAPAGASVLTVAGELGLAGGLIVAGGGVCAEAELIVHAAVTAITNANLNIIRSRIPRAVQIDQPEPVRRNSEAFACGRVMSILLIANLFI